MSPRCFCDNLACRFNRNGECWTSAISIENLKCVVEPEKQVNEDWEGRK